MTITNLMHVTGSKADLYSPSYFKKVAGERPAVNPFERWVNGKLIAFGTAIENREEYRLAIDLTGFKTDHGIDIDFGDDPIQSLTEYLTSVESDVLEYKLESPFIPPSVSYLSWIYRFSIERHEHHFWNGTDLKWDTELFETTRYIKNGKPIVPTKIITTATYNPDVLIYDARPEETPKAEELHHYYFLNRFDFSAPDSPKWCSIDCKVGDDLWEIAYALSEKYKGSYGLGNDGYDATINIYDVDITEADTADRDTEKDTSLMGYWLGKLTSYPRMFSVDQNPDIEATYGNIENIKGDNVAVIGDFEYRHALQDAVFSYKKRIGDIATTLPICNGLLCYPTVMDGKLFAHQGQRLSYNEQDRNRRWVLVDFGSVGGCTFKKLSEFDGPISELTIPNDEDGNPIFDPSTQSLLLSICGRLFTAEEFEIVDDRILFNINRFSAIYELDRMICRGDFIRNSRFLETKKSTVSKQYPSIYANTIQVVVPTTDTYFTLSGRPCKDEVFYHGKIYLWRLKGDDNDPVKIEDIERWYGRPTYEIGVEYEVYEPEDDKFESDGRYFVRTGTGDEYEELNINTVTDRVSSFYDTELEELAALRSMPGIYSSEYEIDDLRSRLDIFLYALQKLQSSKVTIYKGIYHDVEIFEEVKYLVELCGEYYEATLPQSVYDEHTPIDKTTDIMITELKDINTGVVLDVEHLLELQPGIQDYKKFVVNPEDGKLYPCFNKFYERVIATARDTFVDNDSISKRGHHTTDAKLNVSLEDLKVDLKNDENSFAIIINKPGLRVIRHRCFEGHWPHTKMPLGTDAKTGTMRVDFDRQVRGLLFDETTKSVIDYTRETQSMTFYVDRLRRWGIANVSANWSSLLAIADESSHNSMSARGFVIDNCHDYKYNQVIWPRLSILDFTFRD